MIKLSVIIVNYNVKHFLEQCLLSVKKAALNLQTHSSEMVVPSADHDRPTETESRDIVEIIVVDNNSVDGSCKMVQTQFPHVSLISNDENMGFSFANNQGITQTKGEYILLLNPDTVVEENTFVKAIDFMDNQPDAGGLGVKMLDGKGHFLPESKRAFPSPSVAFYKMVGLSKLFPRSKVFGKYHLGYLEEDKIHEVNVLSGAFMLIRKEVLEKTGTLDEAFFMYGEDIDLSYRIVKAGYKNYYFPDTRIIHYKGESTKKGSLNYLRLFFNAMIIFADKHLSRGSARLFIFSIKLAIYFRAGFELGARFIKSIYLPMIDAALIYTSMVFLKGFWGRNIMGVDRDYYAEEYLYVNVPLYITIWLSSTYFSGWYDKPHRVFKLLRGLLFGTLVIAAIYGFLEESYRFSRGMILIGAVIAFFTMLIIRLLFHFIRYRNFELEGAKNKKVVIVGSNNESQRVLSLLNLADVDTNYIGFISSNELDGKDDQYLGSLTQLKEIVEVYRIGEVIFCSKDIPSQDIIGWMSAIGGKVDFKIVPEESINIIGSNSKNTSGDLYAVDINLNITNATHKRNKRVLDIIVCGFLLMTLPISYVLMRRSGLLQNWFSVFAGRRSWVGYGGEKVDDTSSTLPPIKDGVLSSLDIIKDKEINSNTIARLNLLYAKDYSTSNDLRIIWGGFRELGRVV